MSHATIEFDLGAAVAIRTEVFDNADVRGAEFQRQMKAAARRRKSTYPWVPERGGGSHGTLYVGTRFTIVNDLKKELGPGLLSDMCKQLGIRKEDL
jgi:mRNA interferase HicA